LIGQSINSFFVLRLREKRRKIGFHSHKVIQASKLVFLLKVISAHFENSTLFASRLSEIPKYYF